MDANGSYIQSASLSSLPIVAVICLPISAARLANSLLFPLFLAPSPPSRGEEEEEEDAIRFWRLVEAVGARRANVATHDWNSEVLSCIVIFDEGNETNKGEAVDGQSYSIEEGKKI